jgi:hypothetical protein
MGPNNWVDFDIHIRKLKQIKRLVKKCILQVIQMKKKLLINIYADEHYLLSLQESVSLSEVQ